MWPFAARPLPARWISSCKYCCRHVTAKGKGAMVEMLFRTMPRSVPWQILVDGHFQNGCRSWEEEMPDETKSRIIQHFCPCTSMNIFSRTWRATAVWNLTHGTLGPQREKCLHNVQRYSSTLPRCRTNFPQGDCHLQRVGAVPAGGQDAAGSRRDLRGGRNDR